MIKSPLILSLFALLCGVLILDAQESLIVTEISGQIRYRFPGKPKVSFLRKNMEIPPGGKVKMSDGCHLKLLSPLGDILSFSNKSYFRVGEADFASKASKLSLHLHRGKVNCKVKKLAPESYFIIKTPYAVTGVRGTDFDVEVGDSDFTAITVNEGAVAVAEIASITQPVVVTQGETATVAAAGGISVGIAPAQSPSTQSEPSLTGRGSGYTTTDSSNSATGVGSSDGEDGVDESNDIENSPEDYLQGSTEDFLMNETKQKQSEMQLEKLINLRLRINDKD
ncbi:MAG: FecR domain-containing protein [Planctomycetes bacterium]|nr:FecR domain-containing protein [Planctomycetota bacterium]